MRGVPSPTCSRPRNGCRCLATWIRPPPFTPEKNVTPHLRSVSMRAKLPLVCSSAMSLRLVVAVLTGFLLVAVRSNRLWGRAEDRCPRPGGKPVGRAHDCPERCGEDVGVAAHPPPSAAVLSRGLDVGHRSRVGAGSDRMLDVIDHLHPDAAFSGQ